MQIEDPILKKMRLKPEQSVLVLNAPNETWKALFGNSNPETGTTYDVIVLFAENKAALENTMQKAEKLLAQNGTIWVAFPKGTSKLQTDLTRDKGWESVPETNWSFLTLISLDSDWSAFSFRWKTNADPEKVNRRKPAAAKESDRYIDMVTRKITLPPDLETALKPETKARTYFDTLAFSHRREYVVWIADAMKPETRQNRIRKMIEMLNNEAKNPRDKTIGKA